MISGTYLCSLSGLLPKGCSCGFQLFLERLNLAKQSYESESTSWYCETLIDIELKVNKQNLSRWLAALVIHSCWQSDCLGESMASGFWWNGKHNILTALTIVIGLRSPLTSETFGFDGERRSSTEKGMSELSILFMYAFHVTMTLNAGLDSQRE